MARQELTKYTPAGPYPTLPVAANSMDILETAADPANKEQFEASGDDLVVVRNSGASPYTVTFTSVVDTLNRSGDVGPYTLAAGESMSFRFRKQGWAQANNKIYMEASNAAIKYIVFELI